jgi:hypothetical protein
VNEHYLEGATQSNAAHVAEMMFNVGVSLPGQGQHLL